MLHIINVQQIPFEWVIHVIFVWRADSLWPAWMRNECAAMGDVYFRLTLKHRKLEHHIAFWSNGIAKKTPLNKCRCIKTIVRLLRDSEQIYICLISGSAIKNRSRKMKMPLHHSENTTIHITFLAHLKLQIIFEFAAFMGLWIDK